MSLGASSSNSAGSPTGPEVHQRRGMSRLATRGSDNGDDSHSTDPYDSVEKDGHVAHFHAPTEKSALQVGTVALLVFFTVSGGPLGSEDAVCG